MRHADINISYSRNNKDWKITNYFTNFFQPILKVRKKFAIFYLFFKFAKFVFSIYAKKIPSEAGPHLPTPEGLWTMVSK